MKVICIDAAKREHDFGGPMLLVEGEPYTVEKEVIGLDIHDKPWPAYSLVEFEEVHAFEQDRFIPLSDKDETESEAYKRRAAERILISKLTRADIEKAYDQAVNNIRRRATLPPGFSIGPVSVFILALFVTLASCGQSYSAKNTRYIPTTEDYIEGVIIYDSCEYGFGLCVRCPL